jgi:hypothetical protein
MSTLLATAPALPLGQAGRYVAAAYVVFVVVIVVYVAIMASKLGRIERELGELLELADAKLEEGRPLVGEGVPPS